MNENRDVALFTAHREINIIEAMKRIDANGSGILFITDERRKLIGTLTDGDIRRVLIKTGNIDCKVSDIMNQKPRFLHMDKRNEAIDYMRRTRVRVVPLVNDDFQVVDVIFNSYPNKTKTDKRNTLSESPVIVMAGGKGTRLYPYTKILPKPLIPVGDIPILERILNRFSDYGVSKFYITVNYKKEMIKSYFSEIRVPYRIVYVEEDKPLGTAGAIRLMELDTDEPVFVTNCDILIEAEYDEVLNFHKQSGNDITIVSSLKVTTIPYGVLHTKNEGVIESIEEKPAISNFINTGMYVINPECFSMIPEDESYDMTSLIDDIMRSGKKVGMYPISEDSFLDMGEFAELKRMEEKLATGYVNQS